MTAKGKKVLAEAMRLSEPDREELADLLNGSIDDVTDEEEWQAAWAAEIKKRLDDMRAGRTKFIPWDQVRRKARAIINKCEGRSQ